MWASRAEAMFVTPETFEGGSPAAACGMFSAPIETIRVSAVQKRMARGKDIMAFLLVEGRASRRAVEARAGFARQADARGPAGAASIAGSSDRDALRDGEVHDGACLQLDLVALRLRDDAGRGRGTDAGPQHGEAVVPDVGADD